ncbi:MAG: glycosyltransferase family 4 protein [Opitutales bacterium]|nr:glycosyltransferase family 4 protein [Opitutales bacterium]
MTFKIVHVTVQPPNQACFTGGCWSITRGLSIALLDLGYEVEYISMKMAGDPSYEVVSIDVGEKEYHLPVHRIEVSDSETIRTFEEGNWESHFNRAKEFSEKVPEMVKSQYPDPTTVVIHCHGYGFIPTIGGHLPGYNVTTDHNSIWTERARMSQGIDPDTSPAYSPYIPVELASFYANSRNRAISCGVKDEIQSVAERRLSGFKDQALRLATESNLQVPGLAEATPDSTGLEHRIVVIPHGVRQEFLLENTPRLSERDEDAVLSWGRISIEKGFKHLFEAAETLPINQFLISGSIRSGQREKTIFVQALEELEKAQPNVTLNCVDGGINGDDLIQLVDGAGIVVLPSLHEPLGNTLLEALARGQVLITTATYGDCEIMGMSLANDQLFCKNAFGYLISSNPTKITEGIIAALSDFYRLDSFEKQAMRQAAKQRVEEHFTWELMAPRLIEELYWPNSPEHHLKAPVGPID